jgi:hypothetical protein
VSDLLTGQQLMCELASRGLQVTTRDGKPVLRGPSVEVTPALLRVLARRKDEVLALAGVAPEPPPAPIVVPRPEDIPRKPPREWLWRSGLRYTEHPLDHTFGRVGCHPAGAWWWRHEGEPGWRVVPGRRRGRSGRPSGRGPSSGRRAEGCFEHSASGRLTTSVPVVNVQLPA